MLRSPTSGLHLARRALPASMDEAWLAGVWEQQAFDRTSLRTTCGLHFQVVYPGRRTGEAGPDFREAILALPDGALLRGDVEIHLYSRGWQQHGHDRDPAYDGVLLHVVLLANGSTCTSGGKRVPTLELNDRLARAGRRPAGTAERAQNSEPEAAQLSYVLAPCHKALPRLEPAALSRLLERLALERFQAKQAVFEGELAVFEPEQVLYAGLMEALGYSRNRAPFRQLAALVPLAALPRASHTDLSLEIERLLLAAAGLAEAPAELTRAGLLGQPLSPVTWQTTGVRPDNIPARRITQFARILARLRSDELLDELLGPVLDMDEPRAGGVAKLRSVWQEQLAEVGPQRADAMAINVLLPFAAAYGQATCQFLLAELATQAYLAYPAQGANQVTRYMRREILGAQAKLAAGACGEQALQHAWERWCHEKVCALCPLGSCHQPAPR